MEPNWIPLVNNRDEERCVGFMFMGRMNGINLYKRGIARRYLHLDDRGQCYLIEKKDAHCKRLAFRTSELRFSRKTCL